MHSINLSINQTTLNRSMNPPSLQFAYFVFSIYFFQLNVILIPSNNFRILKPCIFTCKIIVAYFHVFYIHTHYFFLSWNHRKKITFINMVAYFRALFCIWNTIIAYFQVLFNQLFAALTNFNAFLEYFKLCIKIIHGIFRYSMDFCKYFAIEKISVKKFRFAYF